MFRNITVMANCFVFLLILFCSCVTRSSETNAQNGSYTGMFFKNTKHFYHDDNLQQVRAIVDFHEDNDEGAVSTYFYKNGHIESIGGYKSYTVDIDNQVYALKLKYGTWYFFNLSGYLDSICTYGKVKNFSLRVDTNYMNSGQIAYIDSIIDFDFCKTGDQYYFNNGKIRKFERFDVNCNMVLEKDTFQLSDWLED